MFVMINGLQDHPINMMPLSNQAIGVIGGGAAGFFAAIRIAELNKRNKVTIYEQGGQLLKKVRISGGGRCNVTHSLFDINKFCLNYPRGEKELKSPFYNFQAEDTVHWFKDKGIMLVTESDGRMFPSSNSSETIIKCFIDLVKKHNINILKNNKILNINRRNQNRFQLQGKENKFECDKILICTGSSKHGYELAKQVGHSITELAPSLFSFKVKHPLFKDLSGISFKNVKVQLNTPNKKYKQFGPILITHHGLSGPAILKLSAWAAREMKNCKYKAKLQIQWVDKDILVTLQKIKSDHPKSYISNIYPTNIVKRFWLNLLNCNNIDLQKNWSDISKKEINSIVNSLLDFTCNVNGQNRFKDEFVECGGVNLKEVNFKTMESKITPGVHFAGEILDIDGVTGGFNFQNAWTTAWLAANNMNNK